MFSAVTSHLRAIQFASIATFVTAGLMALPSFASDTQETYGSLDASMQYIATRFQKVGAEQVGAYDNSTIATSAFDFTQYVSHTCYHPTENDIETCKQEFGPFYNLKETMESGALYVILKSRPYYAGAEQFVVPRHIADALLIDGSSARALSDEEVAQLDRDARAKLIWHTCQFQYDSGKDASACYQRNIRLLTKKSFEIPKDAVQENVL